MIFGKHQVALGVLGMLIMGRALPVWAAETADGNVQEIVITANRMENKKVETVLAPMERMYILMGKNGSFSSWMAAASIPVWGIRRRGRPLMPIRCRLWI